MVVANGPKKANSTVICRPGIGAAVQVRGLTKRYVSSDGNVTALDNIALNVASDERLVLLGPSGCGKTTLLRCIAGLEVPDAGEITINDVVVFCARRNISIPPERRGISMVFQSYALWPHMTIFENIAYPLRNRGVKADEILKRVDCVMKTVGCDGLGRRYSSQLSGGQQQRIALARAIISNDPLVLFDEPLSNVDAKVRESLRIELVALQRKFGFAAVYVTHDQLEAAAVAHRIVVMNTGTIAQTGSPQEIYDNPASLYVAEFTGTTNELPGEIVEKTSDLSVISTPVGNLISNTTCVGLPGQKVKVLFRPECVELSASRPDAKNSWKMVVETRMFLGSQKEYALSHSGKYIVVRNTSGADFDEGVVVWAAVKPRDLRIFLVDRG